MDDVSQKLLDSLRARPFHDLDEDEQATLELLEQEEAEYLANPATPEDAAKVGDKRKSRTKALPSCPKCGSEKMDRRRTYAKFICVCKDCGNRYTAAMPAPAGPLPPPSVGPYAPAGGVTPERPTGQSYFRNPKKTRKPDA